MTAWLWFLTNIQGVALWGILNGFHVADDALAARVGLSIRDSTQPDAVVAVTWAGAIPYFSQRQTIDILGKNDRVVARMNPVSRFVPGHDKWDLAHSIGTRQPDVAVGLWWPDLQQFPVEDYEPLPATCFVRRSTHKVNREQLARQLLAAMEQKKRDAL